MQACAFDSVHDPINLWGTSRKLAAHLIVPEKAWLDRIAGCFLTVATVLLVSRELPSDEW